MAKVACQVALSSSSSSSYPGMFLYWLRYGVRLSAAIAATWAAALLLPRFHP
jgi:hypothetical protein